MLEVEGGSQKSKMREEATVDQPDLPPPKVNTERSGGTSCTGRGRIVSLNPVRSGRDALIIYPRILVRDRYITVRALIDTGAMVSVMGHKVWEQVSLEPQYKLEPSAVEGIRGLGNSEMEVLGEVSLPIRLTPKFLTDPITFLVIHSNSMGYDLICGVDMLKQESLLPDLKNRELLVRTGNEAQTVLRLCEDDEHEVAECSLLEDVVIPPRTGKMVAVKLPKTATFPAAVFFCEGIERGAIQVIPGVLPMESLNPLVCVLNTSDYERRLTVGKSLGCVRKYLVKCDSALAELEDVHAVEFPNNPAPDTEIQEWSADSLVDAFGIDQLDLTEVQKQELVKVLFNRREVLSRGDGDVGHTSIIRHNIETETDKPIRLPVRRMPGPMVDEIEKCCVEMEEQGIIRRSYSPYSAPVVPVRKKDGTIRLCIDYRALNAVTKSDSFPLPNLIDMLFSLHGRRYFTSIDLVKGYYQVSMEEDSVEKTAFSTPLSHWEFTRMPFGLKNAPATFQRGMALALADVPWTKALVYLDDILVLGYTFDDHLENLDWVLEVLEINGFKLKPSKTVVCKEEVTFLGHVISRHGMKPLEKNLEGIRNFPVPTTIRKVRQFLGMVNFYRRHIPNCSQVSKPLSELTGKKTLTWTRQCQEAFDSLKASLLSPILLVYPDWSSEVNPLRLYVDASDVGAGACLSQEQEGEIRPIAFVSTSFNPAERRYSTTARELAAIRWAVSTLRPFLYGVKVMIFTDHKPLVYLQNMAMVDSRVARTLEELSQIDYELHYVPGKDNIVADALSRSPVLPESVDSPDPPSGEDQVPPGFLRVEMPGGGDSLFRALSQWLNGVQDGHLAVRQQVVDDLLANPKEYHLPPKCIKLLRLMRHPGQLPVTECLEAFCRRYQVRVVVHFGDTMTLNYGGSICTEQTCHLQCLANVHYNLLMLVRNRDLVQGTENEIRQSVGALDCDDDSFEEFDMLDESSELPTLSGEEESVLGSFPIVSTLETVGEIQPPSVVEVNTVLTASPLDLPEEGNSLSYEWLIQLQSMDLEMRELRKKLSQGEPWPQDGTLTAFRRHRSRLMLEDGLLLYRDGNGRVSYVVSQDALVSVTLQFHLDFAHIGRNKLVKMLKDHLWHPFLRRVASDITRACVDCQRAKVSNTLATPPIFKIHTAYPFELVAADLLALPSTPRGNRCALVVVDHFSKWVAIRPLRSKSSEAVASALREEIFPSLPRVPDRLLTDNGKEFIGSAFQEVLKESRVRHVRTSPYSPSSNGAVERVNRTVTQLLRLILGGGTCWDQQLPKVLHVYNSTLHAEINMSPSECILRLAHNVGAGPKGASKLSPLWEEAGPRFQAFQVGDLVGLRTQHMGDRTVNKLLDRYTGPYQVLRVNQNEVTYEIQGFPALAGRILKCHYRHLRKWFVPPPYLLEHWQYRGWYEAKLMDRDMSALNEQPKESSLVDNGLSPSERVELQADTREPRLSYEEIWADPLRFTILKEDEYLSINQQLLSVFLDIERSLKASMAGISVNDPSFRLPALSSIGDVSLFSGFLDEGPIEGHSFEGFSDKGPMSDMASSEIFEELSSIPAISGVETSSESAFSGFAGSERSSIPAAEERKRARVGEGRSLQELLGETLTSSWELFLRMLDEVDTIGSPWTDPSEPKDVQATSTPGLERGLAPLLENTAVGELSPVHGEDVGSIHTIGSDDKEVVLSDLDLGV